MAANGSRANSGPSSTGTSSDKFTACSRPMPPAAGLNTSSAARRFKASSMTIRVTSWNQASRPRLCRRSKVMEQFESRLTDTNPLPIYSHFVASRDTSGMLPCISPHQSRFRARRFVVVSGIDKDNVLVSKYLQLVQDAFNMRLLLR
jgi:hypothetical protein